MGSGGLGHYHVPPDTLDAFPEAERVRGKTGFPGGIRRRWKDRGGFIYEWDYRHGRVEKFTPRGVHLGEFDPVTGEMVKGPKGDYSVEP